MCIKRQTTILKHQSSPHIELILILTANIWKIKTSHLPLQQRKREKPQSLTAVASWVFVDVKVVPRDPTVYSSVSPRPGEGRKLEQQDCHLECGGNNESISAAA